MRGNRTKVLIIGGGFGGIATAKTLEEYSTSDLDVTLVSDTTHFEYHAALYRVVTGRSPLEVCIPLNEILNEKKTNIVKDRIEKINLVKKVATGSFGSEYPYDYLVFAVGSQTTFFDVPGLKNHSYTLRSINDALRLKNHLHQLFTEASRSKERKPINIVIAGGGATGVELAGELAVYTKMLTAHHQLQPSQVMIELFESSSRILHNLRLQSSKTAEHRLRSLGVNIFVNSPIIKKDIDHVYMEQMKMQTKTLIWTIGNCANELVMKTGFATNNHGQIEVRPTLQSQSSESAFIVGDAAATQYSGMAQTALRDGDFVALQILRAINNQELHSYQPVPPYHSIPIGPGWALLESPQRSLAGSVGWMFRRFVDFKFFQKILPFSAALRAFQDGRKIYETCPECSSIEANNY